MALIAASGFIFLVLSFIIGYRRPVEQEGGAAGEHKRATFHAVYAAGWPAH